MVGRLDDRAAGGDGDPARRGRRRRGPSVRFAARPRPRRRHFLRPGRVAVAGRRGQRPGGDRPARGDDRRRVPHAHAVSRRGVGRGARVDPRGRRCVGVLPARHLRIGRARPAPVARARAPLRCRRGLRPRRHRQRGRAVVRNVRLGHDRRPPGRGHDLPGRFGPQRPRGRHGRRLRAGAPHRCRARVPGRARTEGGVPHRARGQRAGGTRSRRLHDGGRAHANRRAARRRHARPT